MSSRSLNENIAVGVGIVVILIFIPVYFAVIANQADVKSVPSYDAAAQYESVYAPGDVQAQDFVVGTGAQADFGDVLYVHYVGLLENGTTFDTSVSNDVPFSFKLGAGQVILGWELGLAGMREGGSRRITVPSEFGYGDQAVTNSFGEVVIPANSNLTFDVVLLGVDESN